LPSPRGEFIISMNFIVCSIAIFTQGPPKGGPYVPSFMGKSEQALGSRHANYAVAVSVQPDIGSD
jgi:hypothetical protein